MERLRTKCRGCGEEFVTAKQVARAHWWMEAWSAWRERCPNCNQWRTYAKSEFFFA